MPDKICLYIRQDSNERGNDLIDLMIDAMEDKLTDGDEDGGGGGGQFEEDARGAIQSTFGI